MIQNTSSFLILLAVAACIWGYFRWSRNSVERIRKKRLKQGIFINKVDRKVKETKKIYSLELGKELSGGFVLGTGSISDELKYYFYINKEKGKQIESVGADSCVLIEGKKNPKIEYFEYEYNEDWTVDNEKDLDQSVEAFLYVPKNTIKKKFDGNLK